MRNRNVNSTWFFAERFQVFGHHLSIAGISAFAFALIFGISVSSFLQSDRVRKWLSRLGLDKNFVALVTAFAGLGVFLGSILVGLELAGLPVDWHTPLPGIGVSLTTIIRLVVMVVAVFWLSSAAKRFIFNRFLSNSGMERAMQYSVAQIIGYVTLVFGFFIVLQNAGIDMSALTVFAGAAGVGVGLGLQDIASNFLSGLVILTERPIAVGDRIEIGKLAGSVREIRARSTTIVTNDNIALIVPNSHFVKETVTNWSHDDPRVRFRLPVGIATNSDVEKACALLIEVANEHPGALRDPAPAVFFDSFGEFTYNLELVVWSDEMSYRPRRFRSELNFAIERKFRAAGIEIPNPQREITFRNPLEVAKNDGKLRDDVPL